MRFTVVWLPDAQNALAEMWAPHDMRQPVADAANAIDALLRNNPEAQATPVDTLFFLRRDPLVVLFDVTNKDRMVRVIEVHQV
jgi:hypothetical protein